MTETTDPTAAIEVWARMLCAADVHVHGEDHPTWQQLVGEPGSRIRDDYRKAAAWLLPKMTVAAAPSAPADRAAILREAADIAARFNSDCQNCAVELEVATKLRRMADEAQQPKICELPHLTIAEEDACEQHRLNDGAQQPETQADAHPPTVTWEIESPRRGTWASWGTTYDEHDWARQRFEDAIGHVPARQFRLVRATTTYTVEAEHQSAAVSQPVEARQADTAGEQQ